MTRGRAIAIAASGVGLAGLAGLVVALLASPRPVRYEATVVLREGWTMYDDAAALQAAGVTTAAEFLAACTDAALVRSLGVPADDAEGFLFPDTYRFYAPTPASRVVEQLVRGFQRATAELRAAHGGELDALGRTAETNSARAWVVLASLVEAEAAVDRERGRIAAVLWNRLIRRDPQVVRLQVDPTAVYGCRRAPQLASCRGAAGRAPTRAMLDDAANAYNTYRHDGLPPGPIDNPGLASLRAVLERPATDELFYVARGDGTHVFSRTYDEHRAAVAALRGVAP